MENIKLPEGWKIDILDNLTSIIRNGANIKQGEEDGGYPITRIETIANSFIDINKFGYAGMEELGKYKDYLLQEGDILMSHINSEKHLGKVAIYENCNIEIIHGMNLLCLRFNHEILLSKYAYYFLNTDRFKIQLPRITKKSVNQASFSINDLKNLKIIIPPLATQKKIIDVLEKTEKALEKRKESIKLLDELVKSKFIEMFGDPINPLKSVKLSDIALLERGRFSPRPRNDPKFYNGEYPFIQTGDISNSNHRLNKYKQTLNEEGIKVSKCFKIGTILIAIVGATIGATAILEREVYAPDSVIGITPVEGCCNNVFLEMVLRFWQPELLRMAPESARANINLGILQNIPIIKADFELQNQFSTFVNQIDKLKFEMQKSLEKMENNFNSLMQGAFKGELFN